MRLKEVFEVSVGFVIWRYVNQLSLIMLEYSLNNLYINSYFYKKMKNHRIMNDSNWICWIMFQMNIPAEHFERIPVYTLSPSHMKGCRSKDDVVYDQWVWYFYMFYRQLKSHQTKYYSFLLAATINQYHKLYIMHSSDKFLTIHNMLDAF